MRFRTLLLTCAGFVSLVAPASAQDIESSAHTDTTPDLSEMSGAELWEGMMDRLRKSDLSGVRPYALALERFSTDAHDRAVVKTFLGAAEMGDGNRERALAMWEEANHVADVSKLLTFQFLIALTATDKPLAGQILDEMLVVSPAAVRALHPEALREVVTTEDHRYDQVMKDRIVRLAEMEMASRYAWLPLFASMFILEQDATEIDRAWQQLDRIGYSSLVQQALTDRRLEPLWPQLEAKYSDGLQSLQDEEIEKKASALDEDDIGSVTSFMHTLMEAGELDRALELSDGKGPVRGEFASIETEEEAWFINARAILLDHLGRTEEADALYAELVEGHLDAEDRIGIVNFAINWVEQMVGNSQFERAREALDMAQAAADKGNATPYAYQLIARQRYCVLTRTGASAEAIESAREEMAENREEALLATAEAYVCAGERDKAAEIFVEMLQHEGQRWRAVEALQPFTSASARSDPSLWRIDWADLRDDPEVDAAYLAVARDLPPAFRLKDQLVSAQ